MTISRIAPKLISLVVLAAVVYFFRGPISYYVTGAVSTLRSYIAPCSQPISYRVGVFSEGFGITRPEFISAIAQAEAIWEKPAGRQLFSYDQAGGRMPINLVYDYRQETSNKLQDLGATVDSNKTTYDSMVARDDALKQAYAQAKASYESAAAAFKAKYQAYNDKVAYWNNQGGAPKKEYAELQQQQAAMQSELNAVKAKESELNALVSQINSLVVTINALGKSLNLTVKDYNTIGSSLGESFEEGLYHSQGFDQTIDIFEFKTRESLVRVLAHELGHSLGMDHVEDPTAIMSAYNKGTGLVATTLDLKELRDKCRIK